MTDFFLVVYRNFLVFPSPRSTSVSLNAFCKELCRVYHCIISVNSFTLILCFFHFSFSFLFSHSACSWRRLHRGGRIQTVASVQPTGSRTLRSGRRILSRRPTQRRRLGRPRAVTSWPEPHFRHNFKVQHFSDKCKTRTCRHTYPIEMYNVHV